VARSAVATGRLAITTSRPVPSVHIAGRADLVDRLVNEAGELSIARTRIEGEMRSLKGSLLDLTENVIRLRRQLREIEIQAEGQIQAHGLRTPTMVRRTSIRLNSTALRASRN
jgi:chemotaxis protein histidine kinase CheA